MKARVLLAATWALGACDTVYYYGAPPAGDDGDQPLAASCRELHERSPALPDGQYDIQPTMGGTRAVYCDMTRDGGGWTLLTPAEVAEEGGQLVEVTGSVDPNGGYQVTVVPLVEGCNGAVDNPSYGVTFAAGFAWTHMRARYSFGGTVNCWSLFGDTTYASTPAPNLVPFEAGVDAIRDEVRMGGSDGDAYRGGGEGPADNARCDDLSTNFWDREHAGAERSAVVSLRRADPDRAAGPLTGARCVEPNPATLWRYSDIYVR